MNFAEALEVLLDEGTIARYNWKDSYLRIEKPNEIKVCSKSDPIGSDWINTTDDLLATDWMILMDGDCKHMRKCGLTSRNYNEKSSNENYNKMDKYKVYGLSFMNVTTDEGFMIYIESNSLVTAIKRVSELNLPILNNMILVSADEVSMKLANASNNLQSYSIYGINYNHQDYVCSSNGSDIYDLIIGLGFQPQGIQSINYLDGPNKYLLIKHEQIRN